jgi:hypothetical protein
MFFFLVSIKRLQDHSWYREWLGNKKLNKYLFASILKYVSQRRNKPCI